MENIKKLYPNKTKEEILNDISFLKYDFNKRGIIINDSDIEVLLLGYYFGKLKEYTLLKYVKMKTHRCIICG